MKASASYPPTPQGDTSRLPAWITPEAIEETIGVFSPLYGHILSRDEAVGILINIGNLFSVLKGDGREEV